MLVVHQLIAFNLYSQLPYTFQNYSNKEGFNQNTIFAIEQDNEGYLWFGTANGLIRYDGYDFVNISSAFSTSFNFPQDKIKHLHSCKNGLIWIISQNALHVYSAQYEKFYNVFPGTLVHLNRIVELSDSSIWIVGENYIGNVDVNINKENISFRPSPNLFTPDARSLNINDLVELNEDLLMAGTNQGLFTLKRLESGHLDLNRLSDDPFNFNITRIVRQKDNPSLLWIGSVNGLYKVIYDNQKIHVLAVYNHEPDNPESISDNTILDLCFGNDKRLWIGTIRGGLSCYQEGPDRFVNYTHNPRNPDGISSSQINCVYLDSFNTLWLGTAQGGLDKLDLNQKRFYNLSHNPFYPKTIAGDLINFVYEDTKGYLWVSAYKKPLSRSTRPVTETGFYSLAFERLGKIFKEIEDRDILSIYEDKYGYIWLGSNNSISLYDLKRDKLHQIILRSDAGPINPRNIRFISSYGENKILIAGSGLHIVENPWINFSRGDYTLQSYADFFMPETPDDRNSIGAFLTDSKNRIWLGTRNNGLYVLESRGNEFILLHKYEFTGNQNQGLNHNAVFCLYEDPKSHIWIGTFGGGINKISLKGGFEDAVFEYLSSSHGLPDNAVYGIIAENDSILWASTDMGLCRINTSTIEITSFNMNDGLSSNNFRRNAYHKGNSGYFYFGGLNGLTIFKPDDIRINEIPPMVKLASLEVNNHRIKTGEKFLSRTVIDIPLSQLYELKLSHKENSVAFEVLVQHSSSPVNNSLSFRLEGFDPEWITRKTGKLQQLYTNLSPGKYVFRAKGFSGDGLNSVNEINLPITILAPWYQRWWSYTLFGLLIFSIGLGVSWYFVKVEKLEHRLAYEQKDKQRIQQINQAKLQFFTSISHEFRTPLSLISATFQMFDRGNLNEEQKKQISLVDKNTNRLLNLIDQLLTFRKSEQGHLKLKYGQYPLGSVLYPIAEAFENFSLPKEINFIYSVRSPESLVVLDYEKMERVLFNIISNAFKFTPVNGTIKFEGSIDNINGEEYARFDISDNGKGIPKTELNNIFERFYQLNTEFSPVGTGIGLSLSKSIVELHNGFIEVVSEPGLLTRFSVFIPVKQKTELKAGQIELQRNRIEEYLSIESLSNGISSGSTDNNASRHTILVIDDEQEFRDIIKDVLRSHYKLLEARSGKEAEEILHAEEPDLVVSDVMMPEMNGYELCKRIKSEIQTCHIPVVLLTALDQEEMHIQGVEFGADSYITKPFNVKYLLVTIRKLIENRIHIKEHFSKSFLLPPDIHVSSIDQNFIETVNGIIKKNLDDSGFGVEKLAREMLLSPSQFYRKLKQFTGQVPNAYIRNYRLQCAAAIIRDNPGINIKTVMFEVGIESASYFSLAFKSKFGVLPSEYHAKTDVKTN